MEPGDKAGEGPGSKTGQGCQAQGLPCSSQQLHFFECLFLCQSMGIILAFFQKTSACLGSSKGNQKKRNKMTSG